MQYEYNIGDDLCRASHYFQLPQNLHIVQGGTYVFGQENENDIVWSVGRSVKDGTPYTEKNGKALLYSCRDITSDMPYVPCPSVCHPIVKTPLGEDTVVILGGSDTIGRDVSRLKNSVAQDISTYYGVFAKSNRIITNSYHTAYWALLSGRSIKLLGYSSKFLSLLEIFSIPTNECILYKKSNYKSFVESLMLSKNRNWLIAEDRKEEFCDLNIDFYKKVKDVSTRLENK